MQEQATKPRTPAGGLVPERAGAKLPNISDSERLVSVLVGGGLLWSALNRRDPLAAALAVGGGYLTYRGVTGHCALYDALGVHAEGGSVYVEKAVTISRPAEEVYAFWRDFARLPQFMKHLERVEVRDERRSHWVARAPLGATVSWDAELVEDRPGELIAWRSLPEAQISNSGQVRFTALPHGRGTAVHVALRYAPPAGAAGAFVAKLFTEEPALQIEGDLRRLRALLEAGEIPTVYGQTSGRVSEAEQQQRGLRGAERLNRERGMTLEPGVEQGQQIAVQPGSATVPGAMVHGLPASDQPLRQPGEPRSGTEADDLRERSLGQ
jgi:uncharacterized membrane protein